MSASGLIRRHEAREREGVAVRRMAMHAGVYARRLHHGDVDAHLARPRTVTAELPCVHVHEADVLTTHEPLAAEGRCAENQVLANADGDIAAVAVRVALIVDAAPHLADLILDLIDLG